MKAIVYFVSNERQQYDVQNAIYCDPHPETKLRGLIVDDDLYWKSSCRRFATYKSRAMATTVTAKGGSVAAKNTDCSTIVLDLTA